MSQSIPPGGIPVCFLLRRQFSLTTGCFVAAVLGVALISLGLGVSFYLVGVWAVLPFACVQAAALALTLGWHARHAGDFERITLGGGRLVVELRDGRASRRVEAPAPWVRVLFDAAEERVFVVAPGRRIEVGKFVARSERRRLAQEMKARFYP